MAMKCGFHLCDLEAGHEGAHSCDLAARQAKLPPGFVPAKVYMDGPEFLAWLREAFEAGRASELRWNPTFEHWVSARLGTDSVPGETPKAPNP